MKYCINVQYIDKSKITIKAIIKMFDFNIFYFTNLICWNQFPFVNLAKTSLTLSSIIKMFLLLKLSVTTLSSSKQNFCIASFLKFKFTISVVSSSILEVDAESSFYLFTLDSTFSCSIYVKHNKTNKKNDAK